ncbi:MAG: FkbM family methyltransferase [Bryobacteraceae bacterium]
MKRIAGLLVAGVLGASLAGFALPGVAVTGWAVMKKLSGQAEYCPWSGTFRFVSTADELSQLVDDSRAAEHVIEKDDERGLKKVATAWGRAFWVQQLDSNAHSVGFAWLIGEHRWEELHNAADQVKRGDVVLDCGAHVGVFTFRALRRGASKVVAIEPDPSNVECIRRNFKLEIDEGRVVVMPVGVWSKEGTMQLSLGQGHNTGLNSLVMQQGGSSIEVPVKTVDQLVAELGLKRVDYIKMDIEGAEREALRGAAATIRSHGPTIMLDLNHRPDDGKVLPEVIRAARADYGFECGPCQLADNKTNLIPHLVYFRSGR